MELVRADSLAVNEEENIKFIFMVDLSKFFRAEKGYIVVTLDADFHTLLALNEAISPSVIRIRMEGLRAENLTKILEKVIDEFAQELEVGAAITVEQNRIRIRRLPLLSNI